MPGVFEFMKRMVQGKPVFDPNDQPSGAKPIQPNIPVPPAAPQGPQTHVQKGNDRTFPVVLVKRTTTRVEGNNRMRVYCRLINNSHEMVNLDKIRILRTTRELDTDLRPGEEREWEVYNGPLVTNQSDHQAEIDYKTHYGDYFRAIHEIRFNYHPDSKLYSVEELRLHPPIRDIFG